MERDLGGKGFWREAGRISSLIHPNRLAKKVEGLTPNHPDTKKGGRRDV
jgi:hypothetical protein